MKPHIFTAFLCAILLSACAKEEILPEPVIYPSTFTLKAGIELPTSPDTYEEILYTIQTMVEEDVMSLSVPYHVNLLELGLFDAYEFAYSRAYQHVNATHMEFTSNTSGYQIGYHITALGDFTLTFERSDANYGLETIREQNEYFRQEVDIYFNSLLESGRFSWEMDEMSQIKALFDFTLEHLSYDFSLKPISFTAYGAVTTQEVVCQGYVALFNALLKKANFQAEGVIGTSFENGEGHIWTRVNLGDTWHYFDPTYADRPSYTIEEGDLLYNYTYFDMSQDIMLYDRTTTHYLVNSDTLVLPT